MPKSLRATLAQINVTVGDFKGNREKILAGIAEARRRRSRLVTFPELAVTGYPPEDLLFEKHFVDENLKSLRAIAPHTRGVCAVIGFVDRDPRGRLFNAAALVQNRRVRGVYHKMELPNYGVFDEKRYFWSGEAPFFFETGGARLGLTVCEDIWQKDGAVYQKAYRGSAAVVVNISASPYHAGKQKERFELLRRLARRTGSALIYQNLVGGQDELVFDGASMVLDVSGRLAGMAESFREDFFTLDVPLGKARRTIKKPKVLTKEEEVYRALVLGTRDYAKKNGFKKTLVGLSGGIDSALVACIAADALGPENVTGVTLPSGYTSSETYRDAKKIAENLRTALLEFDIQPLFEKYLETLRPAFRGLTPNIAEENLQARIRGTILMALSNKFGDLVLTTGNKSEMAMGYCTLYGDMAGGFAVLKDVPKTLVFALARHRNRQAGSSVIPPSVIERAPSAELRPNQKDEDSLPPYKALDPFLEDYVEKAMSIHRIRRPGISRKEARQVARRVISSEYKRRQAPPGIKITPRAFGRDRRMPITSRFKP